MTDRLGQVEPRLDESARERLLTCIHAELTTDARAAKRGSPPTYAWVALVAAAALVMWWVAESPAPGPVASTRATRATPQREAAASAPELVPYLFSGGSAARADALLAHPQQRLELAAGERVLAMLGDRVRLALVGPAALRVVRAQASRVELALEAGTLLGDYDHTRGGALIIDSPGARTEVVGTLFSVRGSGDQSRVAVARGKVQVRAGDQRIELSAGKAWSAASSTAALSEAEAAELALHDRSLRLGAEPRGVLGITGPQLEAEAGERWLGLTPLWASVPAGSNTIALRDLRDSSAAPRLLTATVRGAARTELVVEPTRADDAKPRAAPAARAKHAKENDEPPAGALYAAAERAMRDGQIDRGSQLLEQLLAKFPTSPHRDLALYDLALAAYKQGDFARAGAWLDRLAAQPARPALRELGAYLRCRAIRARAPAEGPACFEDFRRRYPRSPHATEIWPH